MRIDLPTVWTIFRSEMRMVLRHRRAVLVSIILPLVLMPVMIFGSHWSIKKRETRLEKTAFRFAISGSQSNVIRGLLDDAFKHLAAQTNSTKPTFTEIHNRNPLADVEKGNLEFVLEGLTPAEILALETNRSFTLDEDRIPLREARPGVRAPLVVRLIFRGNRDESTAGAQAIRRELTDARNRQRGEMLQARGFPVSRDQVAVATSNNISSPARVTGLSLGRNLTLFLLFFIFMGGSMIATDMLAGEKERGTLETLLTSSVGRVEIIIAKHLVVLSVALITTFIQAVGLLTMASLKMLPLPDGISQALPPAVILLLFVLYVPVMALVAEILLLISGYAKDYKEAQLYFLPVFILGMLPALTPYLPGLSLRSIIALIPMANIALSVKEVLSGTFDWPMIALSWLVSAGAAIWLIRVNVRFLSAEKLVTASDTDAVDHLGGQGLFERRVWVWFGILWGAMVMVNNYIADLDIRLQLTVNLVILFLSACLLMIRTYRLDIRSTLSLRWPKPAVWIAVLAGVLGGTLTGTGIMYLVNYIIPVPPQMIESFGQSVVPGNMSFLQLIFFLAVLPGVIEEITFRGLLLHGLRRRLKPAVLVLAVGLVFGLFHVALFRLAPTAFLGMLLAAVTLLTGSIFPAMLWHALNNTLAVVAFRWQIAISDLPGPYYLAGPILLACAFWIIWRNRTTK